MDDPADSPRPQRFIGAAEKAVFIAALRRGLRREDAAAEAGFSLMGFYGARSRDPAFAAAWKEALAALPAAALRARAYEERDARLRGEVRIAVANRRILQRRRRFVRFDARRREIYLAHFAANCDTVAAAAAAGVSPSTVTYHCRRDPVFAAACAEALRRGYAFLEAEALRQRIAAQARLRAAIAAAGPTAALLADQAAEFERLMRLFARLDRKPRRVERGFREGGRRQRMTFEEAIRLLDKRLRAMGARTGPPPGEIEGEGEQASNPHRPSR